MPYKLISRIKKIIAANLLFAIFIAIISAILIIRALPENHIDMPSADTLNTARWWTRDGFLTHYLLHHRAGYGKIVHYLEEPELNDHARGSVAGSAGHHKNYGTHYPNMDAIPVALLMKLGIGKIFPLKLPAITASILGLILLYTFIKKLLYSKYIAFIAVSYFGISPIFIKWGDALDYIPYEDLWRSLILLLSLIAFRYFNDSHGSVKIKRINLYLPAIWLSYLLLALTSYNSTFFIFTWLIGLSAVYIYNNHNVKNKIWFFIFLASFWASAPVFGFVLRLIQSAVYMGWHNTWLDIYGAFAAGGNRNSLDIITRFEGIIKPFFSATGLLNIYATLSPLGISKIKNFFISSRISSLYILPLLVIPITIIVIKLKKITNYKIPSPYLIFLLAIAPLSQTFMIPLTGYRDNMGRLAAPFVGIIIGILCWMLFLAFSKNLLTIVNKILFLILSFIIVLLFTIQILLHYSPRLWPSYAPISDSNIAFAKTTQKIADGEKAVFMVNADDTKIPEEELKKRWSLYDPSNYQTNYLIWEYYFDMPLLNFTKTSYLIKDLLYLEKRSEFPFTAIVTSDDTNLINELHQELKIILPALTIKKMENRYYFIITPIAKKDSL